MTREDEKRIRLGLAKHAGRDLSQYIASQQDVRLLLAEVDRLRALPVVPTCGACGYCEVEQRPPLCWHPLAEEDGVPTKLDGPPPSTCPLRGAP